MRLRVFCISIFSVLCLTAAAAAAPITYIYTGTASGTLNGTPFTNADFTITGHADTNDLTSCGAPCVYIDHVSTDIAISGVGTYTFTTPLRTFLNGIPGLSRAGFAGSDLYDIQGNFAGWDLISNWGPVSGNGSLLQWASPSVQTSGGVLVFPDLFPVPATFQAVLGQPAAAAPVPTMNEWGMMIFMLLAGLGAVYALKRRRRAEG